VLHVNIFLNAIDNTPSLSHTFFLDVYNSLPSGCDFIRRYWKIRKRSSDVPDDRTDNE